MSILSKGILSRNVEKNPSGDKFWIDGVMTDSAIIDRENEIVDEESYDDVVNDIAKRTKDGRPLPIVIEHRRHDWPLPVGAVTEAWKDGSKLKFKGFISNSPIGQD